MLTTGATLLVIAPVGRLRHAADHLTPHDPERFHTMNARIAYGGLTSS